MSSCWNSLQGDFLGLLILRLLTTDSITSVTFLGIPVHFKLPECLSVFEIFEFKLWMAPCSRIYLSTWWSLTYRELLWVCSWNGYWKRSCVPIGPSLGRNFHTNGLLFIRIQNRHRPVGLQAGMPMETACLVVHLNVHVDLFCKLWRIIRDCFHTETSVALKCIHFRTLSLKVLHTYLSEQICLKISPQTLHRLGLMSCEK